MARLVLWRKKELDRAQEIIDSANREFDEIAIPLGKTISELEAQEAPSKPTKTRSSKRRAPSFAGLTEEQRLIYQELLEEGN